MNHTIDFNLNPGLRISHGRRVRQCSGRCARQRRGINNFQHTKSSRASTGSGLQYDIAAVGSARIRTAPSDCHGTSRDRRRVTDAARYGDDSWTAPSIRAADKLNRTGAKATIRTASNQRRAARFRGTAIAAREVGIPGANRCRGTSLNPGFAAAAAGIITTRETGRPALRPVVPRAASDENTTWCIFTQAARDKDVSRGSGTRRGTAENIH